MAYDEDLFNIRQTFTIRNTRVKRLLAVFTIEVSSVYSLLNEEMFNNFHRFILFIEDHRLFNDGWYNYI